MPTDLKHLDHASYAEAAERDANMISTGFVPRPVGKVSVLQVAGKIMAWKDGQPVLVQVIGAPEDRWYLPLFDDLEPFVVFLGHSGKEWDGFKQVDDPDDFLGSLPPEIVVMVNPWFTEEGHIRWHEVQR
jgi:hypothetical protein